MGGGIPHKVEGRWGRGEVATEMSGRRNRERSGKNVWSGVSDGERARF